MLLIKFVGGALIILASYLFWRFLCSLSRNICCEKTGRGWRITFGVPLDEEDQLQMAQVKFHRVSINLRKVQATLEKATLALASPKEAFHKTEIDAQSRSSTSA